MAGELKIKVLVHVVTGEVFLLGFQIRIFSSHIYMAGRTHRVPFLLLFITINPTMKPLWSQSV